MFYGNGTARIVKNSPWKDKQLGVISDLGSHLIDTLIFLLGNQFKNIKKISSNKYENNSTDHAILMFHKKNKNSRRIRDDLVYVEKYFYL